MKIVLAIDSFKGCLTSEEIEKEVSQCILKIAPHYPIIRIPIADGGEGTLHTLMKAVQGTYQTIEAHNPCMKKIITQYGIAQKDKTALIEMATISGLTLIEVNERNPMETTTFGVGEIIADALNKGCTKFIIGLGGSATNDAGTGMLQALGYRFLDRHGHTLGLGGKILESISQIDDTNKHPLLKNAQFIAACDVTSPFYGPQGAAHTFAKQKGADNTMIQMLDNGLRSFAKIINQQLGIDLFTIPGSGAAGGMGGGMIAFLNAELVPGGELLLNYAHFIDKIADADLIITGEGQMDKQTLMGKLPYHVLHQARQCNIPVIGIAGKVKDKDTLIKSGFHAVYNITPESMPLAEAMKPEIAKENIQSLLREILPNQLRLT